MQRSAKAELPPIPAKRYFTIGEVSDLCAVKPHVLRYWEQEFAQLKPVKRRGNRRYYQHHEVLLIRRIRDLDRLTLITKNGASITDSSNGSLAVVDIQDSRSVRLQGFTINGARHRLDSDVTITGGLASSVVASRQSVVSINRAGDAPSAPKGDGAVADELRQELLRIRQLLGMDR